MTFYVPDHRLHDTAQNEELTPEQALDDGDEEAWKAFMDYVRSEFMKWLLEDHLKANDQDLIVRTWMQDWSAKVQRGEL